MPKRAIFWFRRDLRTHDNVGLYNAVKQSDEVIPVFILDDIFLDGIRPDNPRLGFLLDALNNLNAELKDLGSYLLLKKGNTEILLKQLIRKYEIQIMYFNKAHIHKSIEQEKKVVKICGDIGVEIEIFNDSLLVPVERIDARKVFTPFLRLWLNEQKDIELLTVRSINSPGIDMTPVNRVIEDITYRGNKYWPVDLFKIKLKEFDFCNYDSTRNLPSIDGTSRMSPYIRFGLISIRELYKFYEGLGCGDQTYLSEIAWREFWYHIVHNFPECREVEFQKKRRGIRWLNDERWLEAWKNGQTGYPLVDAGMRQLKEEGWIHNRVRMVVASFLTKDLIVDWRYGERHFYDYLVDYDENVNIGNWQWSASVGADPKPLRIFNPILQSQRFDPECTYIKKYIPELRNEEIKKIHDPIRYKLNYHEPVVNHYEITRKTRDIYNKSA